MQEIRNSNMINFLSNNKTLSLQKDVLICFSGAIIISLLAQISIRLPFSPVPITAQTLGILLIGSSFGKKRAFFTCSLYLMMGLMGLPVFSEGKFGLLILLGPTGGYLVGFILAATIMGYLGDLRKDRKLFNALVIFLIGHIVIFSCGLIWLGKFTGYEKVLSLGFVPFVPGAIIKTAFGSFFSASAWKILNK